MSLEAQAYSAVIQFGGSDMAERASADQATLACDALTIYPLIGLAVITSADVKPTYFFICEMHAYSEKSVRACMKLDSEWQHLKYCYKKKVENATEMLQNDRARATLAPAPLF